jgi:hypothetical protein
VTEISALHRRVVFAALLVFSAALLVATVGFASQRTDGPDGPTIGETQEAYDREAAAGGALHDKDLKVVGVHCRGGADRRRWCQVSFIEQSGDPDRVFFDAALLERNDHRSWKLLSGLCRRLL